MVNGVCEKIRLLRIEKNYSQEYIATMLNMSQSYYGRIENGKSTISVECLFKILFVLEADCTTFFCDLYLNQKISIKITFLLENNNKKRIQ